MSEANWTPLGWGEDKLSEFLQRVTDHQFTTFTNVRTAFDKLREVDDCFLHIVENTEEPQSSRLCLVLFKRCHCTYRAACGTSMAGQHPETFVILRSCLEYSGYALLIHQNPNLDTVWLRRHAGADAGQTMRNEFTARKAKRAVESTDPGVGNWYSNLYEDTIDFGGHPNPKGIVPITRCDEDTYGQIDLHSDDLFLRHCLDVTLRVGLCSLHVFHNIFPERFNIELRKNIDELRLTKHL
jgi:hypothetical protein